MLERESDTYRRGLTLGLTMAEIFILILFLLLLVLLALYAFNAELQGKIDEYGGGRRDPLPTYTTTIAACVKDIKKCKKENNDLGDKLAQAAQKITDLEYQLAQAAQKIKDLEDKLAQAIQKIKYLEEGVGPPGIDPPCWYQVTSEQGERHEKPYFLMDIAVYDKYLEVRVQEAPPGHAIDELGKLAATSYQEEYEKLPLPPLGTTKKVSLQQFATMTEPIKRMGKNKQVRDYACVFYVKVWDFTPKTAKTRWKQAEDAIKESFYTLRIRKDPW